MRIPHELIEEFAHERPLIERLMKSDHTFNQLASRYDEINREVFRIESEETPTDDAVLEKLKKKRLRFRDEITAYLTRIERRM